MLQIHDVLGAYPGMAAHIAQNVPEFTSERLTSLITDPLQAAGLSADEAGRIVFTLILLNAGHMLIRVPAGLEDEAAAAFEEGVDLILRRCADAQSTPLSEYRATGPPLFDYGPIDTSDRRDHAGTHRDGLLQGQRPVFRAAVHRRGRAVDAPYPHRHVHGADSLTATRGSRSASLKAPEWQGRMYMPLEGAHAGNEEAFGGPMGELLGGLALTVRLGGYMAESNMGHIGDDIDAKAC